MKLRLELEIEFEHDEDPALPLDEIRPTIDANLLYICENAAGEGLFTQSLEVKTVSWSARVVRLE